MINYCLHNVKGLIAAVILLVTAVVLLVAWQFTITAGTQAMAASIEIPQSTKERLIGRWIRPDGGYVLEIKEIGKDGKMKAAYFNPRSINVARAVIVPKNSRFFIFVELRDVNYPGSTYYLKYDPQSEQLVGTYFQAVQRTNYHVVFTRIR